VGYELDGWQLVVSGLVEYKMHIQQVNIEVIGKTAPIC
jgi:hypothetical protein